VNTQYYNDNPAERDALRSQLHKNSASTFSPQRLVLDLDEARLTNQFDGELDVDHVFRGLVSLVGEVWRDLAKDQGSPSINVSTIRSLHCT
jgi:hypothetical protein